MSNDDALSDLLYASFAADALALGAHWIYDQAQLQADLGRVTDFLAPREDGYHPHKAKGEQSHYGDQALVLMDSLAAKGQFDFSDFAERWTAMWDGYPDYFDHATKDTLANRQNDLPPEEAASDSQDLGGAARLAPLLVGLADEDVATVIAAARQQTGLTHGSAPALDAAEFLTRVVHAVWKGNDVSTAIKQAAQGNYQAIDLKAVLQRVEETMSLSPAAAIAEIGQACPVPQSLPAVISLALRFPHDLETALIENVMAGGDSAGRGLALGLILGAAGGRIPERWRSELVSADRLERFLEVCRHGD